MANRAWSKGWVGQLVFSTAALGTVGVAVRWTNFLAAQDVTNPPAALPSPAIVGSTPSALPDAVAQVVDQAHAACFDGDPYPSAKKCQKCHEDHFREWSVSQHAYAQLSPVFNTFSSKLIKVTNGTLYDFCIRCHTPVGMSLNEPIILSNMDRPPSSREGVTCVVCHRINQPWGKMSARQALVPGNIHQPVYGPLGNEVLEQVLNDSDKWGVTKTEPDPNRRGRDIHGNAIPFFQIMTPGFCGSCHDVFGPDGFRLEDAFSEFKTSPAALKKKQTCQDCHMSVDQGVASGYATMPAARIGNAHTPARKHTNHLIAGPDYSIVHPGIFPHHPYAIREANEKPGEPGVGLATMREWLTFDVNSPWGTVAWESQDRDKKLFPEAWQDRNKRLRGREIIDYNQRLLADVREDRRHLLMHGFDLSEIHVDRADARGIRFSVTVSNATDGHGVPTGFDAERVLFLRVTVCDSAGKLVYQSGDLDPNGDLRDDRSVYVHNGELPPDRALFSLQSFFITRNIRGGERIQGIPVPYSPDPLPFMRPLTYPFNQYGRPILDRKQKQNLEVGGHRRATYEVKPAQLTGCGPYTATVQLLGGMVPVHLINEIADQGFDYHLSVRTIADRIVDGHLVIYERQTTIPCR